MRHSSAGYVPQALEHANGDAALLLPNPAMDRPNKHWFRFVISRDVHLALWASAALLLVIALLIHNNRLAEAFGCGVGSLALMAMATQARRQRDRAEEEQNRWKQAAAFHQALTENAFDGGAIVELNGTIRYVTAAAERILGADPESMAGEDSLFRVHPEDMSLAEQSLQTLAATPRARNQLTLRLRHQNGSYRHIEVCSVNMSHDPAIGGILCSFRDVTESVEADRRLKKNRQRLRHVVRTAAARTAELRQRSEELEGFAFSASHDLRAPLRAVQGYAQALLEDCDAALDHNGREHLSHILDAAERMDQLLCDLLTYSRVARQEMLIGAVDLNAVVLDAVASVHGEVRCTGARIDVAHDLPSVRGHHATLVRVITNVLSNAIKFVAPGVVPDVQVSAARLHAGVRLQICDNGIGVPPEQQQRVFELFERLHGEERYPGTGVGLAIVKRAVNRLGGACGLESRPGGGSCFWIDLSADQV